MASPQFNMIKRPHTSINQLRNNMSDNRYLPQRKYTKKLSSKRLSSPPLLSALETNKAFNSGRNPYSEVNLPIFVSSNKNSKPLKKSSERKWLTIDQLI